MTETDAIDADLHGSVSPPRSNGELVFEAPWERRVFGLVVALSRSGRFTWDDFRHRLIARIHEDESRPYWASWAAAFEDVLDASASLEAAELDARHASFRTRPHGHDHGRA
jgi:nitrile hydratase accessory protein